MGMGANLDLTAYADGEGEATVEDTVSTNANTKEVEAEEE